MPLPIPNLDDTQFQTMVSNALTAIPLYSPQWTDYNLHDPGITFIDLFAWLTEMQQYYLNRIRSDNYLRFLKLLGVRPADVTPALANIAFTSTADPLTVPQGTKVCSGAVVFETTEPLPVVTASLPKVFTLSSAGTRDNSASNSAAGISWMAFGDNAETGSALYLAFSPPAGSTQPFVVNTQIVLTVFLSENYPVPRGSHGTEPVSIMPSARVIWEYFGPGGWAPLSLPAALEPLLAALPAGSGGLCGNVQTTILNAVQAWPLFPFLPLAAQTYITAAIQGAMSNCALRGLATDPALLALLRDETAMFSLSGRFFFTAPGDMAAATLLPANTTPYFWIRARVAAQGFEIPPRVNQILLNTVTAVQTDTRSEVSVFSSNGGPSQSFQAATFLSQQGAVEVQVQQSPGLWQQWEQQNKLDTTSKLNYTFNNGILTFGDGAQGQIPPQGTDNIRLIACPAGSQGGRFIGQGNGLPNQQFPIVQAGVAPGTLLLQSSVTLTNQNPIWRDWAPADNFDAAGPGDYQFVFDAVNNVVLFGDGVNGATPPPSSGARNVRWIELQLTQGSQGNVSGITMTPPPLTAPKNLTWTNVEPASGGADPETLAAAELRARRDLNTPYRAVTIGDFEYDAIHTPGLRVSRAQAIPDATQNSVTVVVVPYSTALPPTPSRGFLQTVCRHLMSHRLITTSVQVIAPQYVTVTVQATISLQAGAKSTTVQQAAVTALQQFLNPLTGGSAGQGWPFGRTVYMSDIYRLLNGVAGLSCVQTLSLSAAGAGATLVPGGDVTIPAESLVVSGNHTVTVSSNSGVCPPTGVRK
jgi:hypothetical protein